MQNAAVFTGLVIKYIIAYCLDNLKMDKELAMYQNIRYVIQTRPNDGRIHMWNTGSSFEDLNEALEEQQLMRDIVGDMIEVRVIEWSHSKSRVVASSIVGVILCLVIMGLLVLVPSIGSQMLTEFLALTVFAMILVVIGAVWFCADSGSVLIGGDRQ